ncbi:MAG: glycosyltransferase family 4 protein [Pseudomonadota bacterium]|nr:glycosyltransferase family 4 protein [Pseudomonadota bacterium]
MANYTEFDRMNRNTDTQKRRARILMYTAYFEPEYSGAALQGLTLAKELRRRGHHIEFVTNRWSGLGDKAEVDGFAVQRLEPGRMRKHREFRLWFNLARYVWARRRDFDILHSHGAYFTNAFIGPLARMLGLKSLIKASLADDDLQGLYRPIVGRLHRLMLRGIDAYVAISQDLVDEFRAGGLQANKIHHLPNGVDTDRFHAATPQEVASIRAELMLPSDQPIALYVGVLDQRKNILWLADQWIRNDAFGTGALLLAVGPQGRDDAEGHLRARLAELASAHPKRFALHDFHADVTPYYQCVDLLLLPSAKEGLPNVVLEAMACGLPCIAAKASGSRELIVEGETGYTYAPADIAELAMAVKRCLSSLGAGMGAKARRLAEDRYSIVSIANQYEAIYARLLGIEKRILYVENGIGYGGAIICLRHLVRNIDRSMFEPMVITGLGDNKYQEIANEARWKHIPDKRIDIISMKRRLSTLTWPDKFPGLRWAINQVLSRLDDLVNFLPSLIQTLWTVLRFKPDLIHVNNEPLCNRAAVLAGKLLNIPVVSHVRGDQQGSLMMRSFFKLPDYFIAVSQWVSESIGRIGVSEQKRTFIYDGIELEKLNLHADGEAFRHFHGILQNSFVIGLVGLLIPWKGQKLFLEAIRPLAHQIPDAIFAIVGGTPDEFRYFESELRELADEPILRGRVVFTGHVSDMASVYNGLNVIVSASISPEPLGTMIIEAMTMARPIIAPDHGGAVEMIENGKTGLLFRPGDAHDLASKISLLRNDIELCKAIGQSARLHALKVFSISEHVRQVQKVYKKILGNN